GEARKHGLTRSPENRLLFLFSLVLIISSAWSDWPTVALNNWDAYVPWVLIYVLIVNSITTRERVLLFVALFLLVSFKMSQHGFVTWAQSGFGFSSWGVTGAPGFFQNSGEVGIQMCIFLPICLCCLISLRKESAGLFRFLLWLMPITAVATIIAS